MSLETDLQLRSARGRASAVLAVTGGGTGGHVYPALAVVAAYRKLHGDSDVVYLGSAGGMEGDLARRARLRFCAVSSGALRGRGPLTQLGSVGKLGLGVLQALAALRRHHVRAVLATGGYVSAPVVLAAWSARIPSVIYLPDVEPGLAVRFLSSFAQRVAVTCEQSRRFLPRHKVVVTGYPLREDLLSGPSKTSARARLGLADNERVLLVLGGSRGAHSINVAIATALPELVTKATVLHSSGIQDESWLKEVASRLPRDLQARYRIWPYLHEELPVVMAGADLAISRSGASVMGEYPCFGLPSILVPYPHAGAHQEHNADYLVDGGAATKLRDDELDTLLPVVSGLLGDGERLSQMSIAARSLARPNAANVIAKEMLAICSRT